LSIVCGLLAGAVAAAAVAFPLSWFTVRVLGHNDPGIAPPLAGMLAGLIAAHLTAFLVYRRRAKRSSR
jgi:hypothetical protein